MAALPVEVYEVLEEKFGKEDAKTILHALEKSLNAIKNNAKTNPSWFWWVQYRCHLC